MLNIVTATPSDNIETISLFSVVYGTQTLRTDPYKLLLSKGKIMSDEQSPLQRNASNGKATKSELPMVPYKPGYFACHANKSAMWQCQPL